MAKKSGSAITSPTSMLISLRGPRSGQPCRVVQVRREPEIEEIWGDQLDGRPNVVRATQLEWRQRDKGISMEGAQSPPRRY